MSVLLAMLFPCSHSCQSSVTHCLETRGELLRLGAAIEPLKDRCMLVHVLRPLSDTWRQCRKRPRPGIPRPVGVAGRLAGITEQSIGCSDRVPILSGVATVFV